MALPKCAASCIPLDKSLDIVTSFKKLACVYGVVKRGPPKQQSTKNDFLVFGSRMQEDPIGKCVPA